MLLIEIGLLDLICLLVEVILMDMLFVVVFGVLLYLVWGGYVGGTVFHKEMDFFV